MSSKLPLFGGEVKWNDDDWTASDDRVRGGSSQSHLSVKDSNAIFYGHLDTKTLGGAGFASQRTVGEDKKWDLSKYDGVELVLDSTASDDRKYTFIIKDQLLHSNPDNGREQSTISWEYDFELPSKTSTANDKLITLFIPWKDFSPTYRGREQKDAGVLKLKEIKRFSIMMRSFFATQEGGFKLTIVSITASTSSDKASSQTSNDIFENPSAPYDQSTDLDLESESELEDQKVAFHNQDKKNKTSIWNWLFGRCWKL